MDRCSPLLLDVAREEGLPGLGSREGDSITGFALFSGGLGQGPGLQLHLRAVEAALVNQSPCPQPGSVYPSAGLPWRVPWRRAHSAYPERACTWGLCPGPAPRCPACADVQSDSPARFSLEIHSSLPSPVFGDGTVPPELMELGLQVPPVGA